LSAVGLDWESILVGAQIDWEIGELHLLRRPFLDELAAFGTDRAASLMVLLATQTSAENRPEYASAIRVLIADDQPHYVRVSTDEEDPESNMAVTPDAVSRVSKVKISEKTRKQLLGVLVDWAKADVSNELGPALVRAFEFTNDPTVVTALRRLAAHPSYDVASRAVARLKGLGEKIPDVAKQLPVRFQILVNGKKLPPGANIDWRVQYGENSGYSEVKEVDKDCCLSIDRDHFVDPHQKATGVSFSSWNSEPAFSFEAPVPPDLSKLTTVQVELIPLRVEFDLAAMRDRKRFGEVKVGLAPPSGRGLFPRYEKTGPVGEPMILLVQKGEYTMTAKATGAATWESTVQISKESPLISVPLRPGSDVHLMVFKPGGQQAHGEMLFHNGQVFRNWRDEKGMYRGLPPGDYLIHIPSSKEGREIFLGAADEAGPDEVDYAGRDMAVTVSEGSPPLIDLGDVRLEALNR